MSAHAYSEDNIVQQTTAEYLERQLGWESVYAYNTETFGPTGTLGRASDREMVLTRYLREKLVELNPELPEDAYDDAVRQIVTIAAIQTPFATNREKYAIIKDGVQVTFRNAKGERVKQRHARGTNAHATAEVLLERSIGKLLGSDDLAETHDLVAQLAMLLLPGGDELPLTFSDS